MSTPPPLRSRFVTVLAWLFIGMTGFGASAPFEDLYKEFGITAEAVAAAARRCLG